MEAGEATVAHDTAAGRSGGTSDTGGATWSVDQVLPLVLGTSGVGRSNSLNPVGFWRGGDGFGKFDTRNKKCPVKILTC